MSPSSVSLGPYAANSSATLADSSPLATRARRGCRGDLVPALQRLEAASGTPLLWSLWIRANHERPSVSLSAMTSEAARKVCSCASVASAKQCSASHRCMRPAAYTRNQTASSIPTERVLERPDETRTSVPSGISYDPDRS